MGNENEEELFHQVIGVHRFLVEKGYEKVANKLLKELNEKNEKIPDELDGEWKWISHVEYVTDSSSSEEDESSSEESESESEDDESASDDYKSPVQAKARKIGIEDDLATKNEQRRSIKFSDDVDERIVSPKKTWKASEKRACFYDKNDMQRFNRENRLNKSEEAQMKLEELIAATGATMGVAMPPI